MEARALPGVQKILLDHHHCLSQGAYLYGSFSPLGSSLNSSANPGENLMTLRNQQEEKGQLKTMAIIQPSLYLFLPLPLKTFA